MYGFIYNINLRRSHDRLGFFSVCQSVSPALPLVRLGQLLRNAGNIIVNTRGFMCGCRQWSNDINESN